MRRFLAPVLLLAGLGLTQETGYNTNWSGHRTLHLNTSTATGTTIGANVLKYPVLVRLGAADSAVFLAAKAKGADVRFTKSNNTTRIQHQIESWDSVGRSAALWVLLDTVYANNATQSFRLHWGNSAAMDSSKATAVFDSANGFEAVWHLGDSTGNKVRPNSVAGGNPAVPGGSVGNLASGFIPRAGLIGPADTLRSADNNGANDDHFSLGSGYRFAQGTGTISMWTKLLTTGSWNNYMALSEGAVYGAGIGQTGLQNNIFLGRDNNTNNFYFRSSQGTVQSTNRIITNGLLPVSTWAHWTVTFSDTGFTRTIYKDGIVAGTWTVPADTVNIIKPVTRVSNFLGRSNFSTGDRNYRGMMDEVRISKVARSADWVKLDYASQNEAQTLVAAPAAPTLVYSNDSVSSEAGFPIANISPSVATAVPNITSYSINPAIGNGLAFSTSTGTISGTPTAAAAKTKYIVTATNSVGSTTDSVWITITAPSVSEDYTTWTGTKTLNMSGAAMGITGSVSRIPVLVRLTAVDSAIFSAGRASLRFSKANGAKLKYKIDSWDSTARSAAVWVLYDDVTTGTNALRLHWGKAGAVSQSSGPSVFEPSNGYVGVYHMGNPIDTAAPTSSPRPNEARPGLNQATPVNMTGVSIVKPGVIGMADSVTGTGTTAASAGTAAGFSLDTLFTGTFPTGNLTYTVWMQQALGGSRWASAISMGNVVACCGNVSDGVLMGSSGVAARALGYQVATRVGTDGNPTWPSTGANAVDTNTWMYVALAVRAGTTGNNSMYLNGNVLTLSAGGGDRELRDTTRSYVSLGRNVFTGDVPLRGMLDEARIANVARSNDWFKVEYATQRPGVTPITSVTYAAAANYVPGTAISAITPVVSGSASKFTVSPALPAGLAIDSVTGVISGNPTGSSPSTTYTITASNGPWSNSATATFSTVTADGAYASAWSGHKFVNMSTLGSTPNVNTLKLPVLVRLGTADSAIFNASQANGADVRFTKIGDVTRLKHEIEMWDKTNKRAAVWVLLDTVYGNSTGSRFRIHYGNATVADSSKSTAVFDSANGFASVFHMGGTNNTNPRPNAVAGGNVATPFNLTTDAVKTGVIGLADSLGVGGTNGTGSYLSFGPVPVGTITTGKATLSAWIKKTAWAVAWRHAISIGSGAPNNNFWFGTTGEELGALRVRTAEGTTEQTAINASGAWVDQTWQHVQVSYEPTGTNSVVYVNGVSVATGDIGHVLGNVARTSAYIGRALWGDDKFTGVFDEVRLQKTTRSAEWVKLEYLNQSPTSTMVSFSDALVPAVTGINNASASLLGGQALGFKTMGKGLLFQVHSEASSKVRISVVDMFGRTVWNRTTQTGAGMNQITWDGNASNGTAIGSGIYVVRMNLLDVNGKPAASLTRKVPMTH